MTEALCPITGANVAHALALPLGTRCKIGHGEAVALALQAVVGFNAACAPEKFSRIAELLGGETTDTTIHVLAKATGLPTRLSEVGLGETDIPAMAAAAMKAQRLLVNNPRPVTEADFNTMLKHAL